MLHFVQRRSCSVGLNRKGKSVTSSFVIKGASILDSAGGFSDGQDIVVEDGVVSAVGPNLASNRQAVLDLDGLWVMPGVFDCHMHVNFSTVDQIEVMRTPPTQLVLEAAQNA